MAARARGFVVGSLVIKGAGCYTSSSSSDAQLGEDVTAGSSLLIPLPLLRPVSLSALFSCLFSLFVTFLSSSSRHRAFAETSRYQLSAGWCWLVISWWGVLSLLCVGKGSGEMR